MQSFLVLQYNKRWLTCKVSHLTFFNLPIWMIKLFMLQHELKAEVAMINTKLVLLLKITAQVMHNIIMCSYV